MVHLDYRDVRPIYTQIADGFREQIIGGILQEGERLPSVRELAQQLAVNPNTIQRAYRELEQEGYLYSVPGKGSFAAERIEVDTQRRDALLRQFDEILVMHGGRITEQGSHDELIALGGTYTELYEMQYRANKIA